MTKQKRISALLLVMILFVMQIGTPVNAASKASINKTELTLYVGKSSTLKLTGTKIKSASSKNSKIASVNAKGKVTAKKAGTTKITVTGKNKKKYTCTVTVKNVSLNKKTLSIFAGEKATLKLNGSSIKSVESDKSSIASITKAGVVSAKKAGTAKITVTAANNKKYTCTVTVKGTGPYKFTYKTTSGYSEVKKEDNGYGMYYKTYLLKVGKDIPAGIYKATSIYDGEKSSTLVYVYDKNKKDLMYQTEDKYNANLIEVKNGQWVELRTWVKETLTLTPEKSIKSYVKYNYKDLSDCDFTYAVYKVGRDIPEGKYRITVESQGDLDAESCYVATSDSLFNVRALCYLFGKKFTTFKKSVKATTYNLPITKTGFYENYVKLDKTFTLKKGQWVCFKWPITKVE